MGLSQSRIVDLYQNKTAELFQNNNVEVFLDNNVEVFQDNSVVMNQDSLVDQSQNSNVEVFQDNSVTLFQDRNVTKFATTYFGAKCAMVNANKYNNQNQTNSYSPHVVIYYKIIPLKMGHKQSVSGKPFRNKCLSLC